MRQQLYNNGGISNNETNSFKIYEKLMLNILTCLVKQSDQFYYLLLFYYIKVLLLTLCKLRILVFKSYRIYILCSIVLGLKNSTEGNQLFKLNDI